jgi:hypothetical protein
MTIEAPSRNPPQVAPLPPAPARVDPAETARPGQGHGAATKAVPPPPPEPELMVALSSPEAAKIAVETFHELQGELLALERAHPASRALIDAKRHEVNLAQDWAIKAATKNRDLAAAKDKQADGLRQKMRSEADKLSNELPWNEGGHERSTLSLLQVDAVKAEAAYNSVHARFLDAESLLRQANSDPEGYLESAENDLKKAEQRYFAADMKLKAAEGQIRSDPRIVAPARRELESARAAQADAWRAVESAGKSKALYEKYYRR